MKIRTAIFGVYVVASAIGFAAVMGLVLRDVRLRYVESMRRTLGDTASYLAAFAAPTSAGEDWTRKLTALPKRLDVLRVFACDTQGRVVFDSAGRDLGQTYAWNMTGGGRTASENYTVVNVAEVGNELRVAAAVKYQGELKGWVGVGRPLSTVTDGVRAARWRLVEYAAVIALVMALAGWWLAARLTHSLERLADYAREVRDGRPAAPPPSRAVEIAALGRAFEEMRDALEGRQHAERYTQALAHEVKAPLAAIRGAAELLGEDLPAAQREKFLGNIRSEGARIQQSVDRLLELSSLEARKALQQTEAVDVAALMQEAADVLRPACAAAGVTLRVSPATGTLRGERVLLREALVNLLQNAREFSPAGGTVTFTASKTAGRVVFTVTDDGPGVPDYALPRVFERFYSLPRPGTNLRSTGLGLALVQEIALLHDGEVALGNRPGGGAIATLRVPAQV